MYREKRGDRKCERWLEYNTLSGVATGSCGTDGHGCNRGVRGESRGRRGGGGGEERQDDFSFSSYKLK